MTKLFSYVLDHDLGFAPNPFGGFCTLAKCKFGSAKRNIVEMAEEGDWIAGTGGADLRQSAGHGKLIYAMRVDAKLPLAQYCRGNGGSRIDAAHDDVVQDGRFALISNHFFYFGRNAIDILEIPTKHLRHAFEKTGPGYRCDFSEEFIEDFAKWLNSKFKGGVHGPPCKPHSKLRKPRCPSQGTAKVSPLLKRQVVLLRVGIDSGSGGIQGPLFNDGSFEFICIPDRKAVSEHKYGTSVGKNGVPHSDYFPATQREQIAGQHVHLDPEFETFTYGDPTPPKRSLRTLKPGDLLVFYCGLQKWNPETGWNRESRPALYIIGYFDVAMAGMAIDFTNKTLLSEFRNNFHVRYPSVFKTQRDRLVLVKGGRGSRLLEKAKRISVVGKDRAGKPLKVLSPAMQRVFGDFGGHISIQRSPPRWVDSAFAEKAMKWVKELE